MRAPVNLQNGKADQLAANDELSIVVLALSRKLFRYNRKNGRRGLILSIIMIDVETKKILELKCWSELKCFTVYRRVREGEYYKLSNIKEGDFNQEKVNRNYSNCHHEISHNRWWLEPWTSEGKTLYIPCETLLDHRVNELLASMRTVDLVAVYMGHSKGPPCGHIQGYFVNLLDLARTPLRLLIWHKPRLDRGKNFALNECKRGDAIYIPMARFSPKGDSTLTTLFTVVRNPEFISPVVRAGLAKPWWYYTIFAYEERTELILCSFFPTKMEIYSSTTRNLYIVLKLKSIINLNHVLGLVNFKTMFEIDQQVRLAAPVNFLVSRCTRLLGCDNLVDIGGGRRCDAPCKIHFPAVWLIFFYLHPLSLKGQAQSSLPSCHPSALWPRMLKCSPRIEGVNVDSELWQPKGIERKRDYSRIRNSGTSSQSVSPLAQLCRFHAD